MINVSIIFGIILNLNIVFAHENKKYNGYFTTHTEQDSSEHGPTISNLKINDKESINIWAPEVNYETLNMKPLSSTIKQALSNPSVYFRSSSVEAVSRFKEFSSKVRSCLSKYKWPQTVSCIDKVEICFDDKSAKEMCSWESYQKFDKCAPSELGAEGLRKCFEKDSSVFDLYTKCFSEKAEYFLMFNIYGKNAKLRDYYTIESKYYSDNEGRILCRFTYQKNKYHLVSVLPSATDRPPLTLIPNDVYVQDNLYQFQKFKK